MAYGIIQVSDGVEERKRVSDFLAGFVGSGGLLRPRPGDEEADMWRRRMAWWWDENPHCQADSPKGFLIEHEKDGLVGFNGYIPFAYECEGETLPSLVSTTLFVEPAHRAAVLGLMMKQRRLGEHYQLVDGSPSPEMRRLLERFGYQSAGERSQYLIPRRALLRAGFHLPGWSLPLASVEEAASCRLVLDPAQWDGFSHPRDGRIHRCGDRATQSWLLRSGSEARNFYGLLDGEGRPLACALGIHKRRLGRWICFLLDYRDHHPGQAGLGLLMRKLFEEPGALPEGTEGLVLSRFEKGTLHGAPGRRTGSNLYYHLPPAWQNRAKACLPVEGDLVLL